MHSQKHLLDRLRDLLDPQLEGLADLENRYEGLGEDFLEMYEDRDAFTRYATDKLRLVGLADQPLETGLVQAKRDVQALLYFQAVIEGYSFNGTLTRPERNHAIELFDRHARITERAHRQNLSDLAQVDNRFIRRTARAVLAMQDVVMHDGYELLPATIGAPESLFD